MAEITHDSVLFEKTPAHLNNRIKMFGMFEGNQAILKFSHSPKLKSKFQQRERFYHHLSFLLCQEFRYKENTFIRQYAVDKTNQDKACGSGLHSKKRKISVPSCRQKEQEEPFFVVVVLWIRVFVGSDRLMQKKGIFQYIQTGCLITWQLQQAWVLLMVSRVTQITAQSFSISYSLLYSRISSPSRKGQTESQTRQERSSSLHSPYNDRAFPISLPPPFFFLFILHQCEGLCSDALIDASIADNKPLCMFLIALILG